jgi:hypothetical protein
MAFTDVFCILLVKLLTGCLMWLFILAVLQHLLAHAQAK